MVGNREEGTGNSELTLAIRLGYLREEDVAHTLADIVEISKMLVVLRRRLINA
jgi:hypothetical protein